MKNLFPSSSSVQSSPPKFQQSDQQTGDKMASRYSQNQSSSPQFQQTKESNLISNKLKELNNSMKSNSKSASASEFLSSSIPTPPPSYNSAVKLSTKEKIDNLKTLSSKNPSQSINDLSPNKSLVIPEVSDISNKIASLRAQSSAIQSKKSSKNYSRKEESFVVNDTTELEVEQNVLPKITGVEDALEPHMKTLLKNCIVVTKIFSDNETGLVYLDCYSKIGTNFVVEIINKPGVSLYLNDGHVLEKHTGEEFDLSKKMIQAECDKLNECGLFSQQGDKVVIASKKEGSIHKTSYIISTECEKSILEDHHVVAVPVIKFEQLENEDPNAIESLMLLISMRHREYCEVAMRETYLMVEKSVTDLDNLKAYTFSFTNESKVANENFKFRLDIVDKNLNYYKSQGDDVNFALVSKARKELFDDMQSTIRLSREISKITNHASSTINAISEKLNKLRVIGSKYVNPN